MVSGATSTTVRAKVVLGWLAAFPFLVAWPVLSTFPIIAILSGSGSLAAFSVEATFVATGFWGCVSAYAGLKLLSGDYSMTGFRPNRKLAFSYVVLWTLIYAAYAM